MTTPRPRPSSLLPKPPITLHPTCVIADSAILAGTHPISIGADTILHPRARIVSTYAPVVIGRGCIVSEKVVVGLQGDDDDDGSVNPRGVGVVLGEDVVLEPACWVQGNVGRGSCVEAGAKVGRGAVVGEYCKIGPLCSVANGEVLSDYEVLFGNGQRRKERPGLEGFRKVGHDKEIQVLKKLIPSNLAKWQTVGER